MNQLRLKLETNLDEAEKKTRRFNSHLDSIGVTKDQREIVAMLRRMHAMEIARNEPCACTFVWFRSYVAANSGHSFSIELVPIDTDDRGSTRTGDIEHRVAQLGQLAQIGENVIEGQRAVIKGNSSVSV